MDGVGGGLRPTSGALNIFRALEDAHSIPFNAIITTLAKYVKFGTKGKFVAKQLYANVICQ